MDQRIISDKAKNLNCLIFTKEIYKNNRQKRKSYGYYLKVTLIILHRYRIGVLRHYQLYMFLSWQVDYHNLLLDRHRWYMSLSLQQGPSLVAMVPVLQLPSCQSRQVPKIFFGYSLFILSHK
jgi:hypothetical protein